MLGMVSFYELIRFVYKIESTVMRIDWKIDSFSDIKWKISVS